jgi:diguanylate cyclase (GGDEF)-like protein
MIDEVGIGMVRVDEQNNIIDVNNTIKEWFGDFSAKTYQDFLDAVSKFPINEKTRDFVAKTNIVYEVISNEYHGIDKKKYKLYVFKDISKDIYQRDVLNRLALQYKQKAEYDPLTKLLNRNALEGALEKAFYEADRKFSKLAFMFLDLDGFKEINDTYGHQAGDTVLKIVAKRINNSVKKRDIKARYAGDEFVVVLTGIESRDKVQKIAQHLLKLICEPITLNDGTQINISASIGIACYPDDATTVKELLKKADHAMYQVKFNEKSAVGFYTKEEN